VPPEWAYVVRPADQAKPLVLRPAPDWHPADHAPMPAIVARGRAPAVVACGYCHRADGSGGPENATLSGLSAEYMTRQVADFRSGARTGSEPLRLPTATMAAVVRAATDSEIAVAVRYFAAEPYLPHVTVVESDTAPSIRISGWLLVAGDGPWEPVGRRIIELPDDQEQFERRDTHARRTAWVPPGSIAKGKALVATINCASCHGPGLHGLEPAPALAGRSPVYILRQLYDFKSGARAGSMGGPMKLVTEQLTLDEMIAAAAYVASLPP
jgi:cytochrome c553